MVFYNQSQAQPELFKWLFYSLLFLFPLSVLGQSSNLLTELEALKKQVGEVKTEKNSYKQQLNYDPDNPYRLEVVTLEVDKKGRTSEKKVVLNLGLLDKNLVRRENSSDLMWISAGSAGMPVIKSYKDGEIDRYSDELELFSKDVDNARAIEESLKVLIPLAEKAWRESVSLPKESASLRRWIIENTGDVDAGDASYKQKIEADGDHPGRVWLTLEEYNDKGLKKTERFGLNFGDLHEPSVEMKVGRKEVAIEADVRQNQKFISHEEDGAHKGYEKSLTIYTEDVDQAQLLVQALRDMIPMAREESEKVLLKPSSADEGLELLSRQLVNFEVDQEKYEQSLTGGPLSTYTRRVSNDKGSEEEKFTFDLGDLNEQAVTIDADKNYYVVEVPTKNSKPYVEVIEKGEQQNYEEKVSFFVPDLQAAKQLQNLLLYTIKAYQRPVDPRDLDWLSATLAGFDDRKLEIHQALERREAEKCKASFTTRTVGGKKAEEHLYEFNFYDLDPEKASMEVKGKTVTVSFPTNYREEIIKDYENGDKISYKKEIAVVVPDIETGKVVMATLQDIVKNCPKK